MSLSDAPPPSDTPDAGSGPGPEFNPFVLLDIGRLDQATLSRYAVFLIGLRRTLRSAVQIGAPEEMMIQEFLDEVEEALSKALAARREQRPG